MNDFRLFKIISLLIMLSFTAGCSVSKSVTSSTYSPVEGLVDYPTTHDQRASFYEHYLLGRIAAGQEHYQIALNHYLAALQLEMNTELAGEALLLSEQLNDVENTLMIAKQWVEYQPDAIIPWKLIAFHSLKNTTDATEQTILAIEQVIELEQDSNELLIFLDRLLTEEKLDQVKNILQRLVNNHPKNRALLLALSKLHQQQGQWTQALAITDELVNNHPDDLLVWKFHGSTLVDSGESEKAIQWYKKSLKQFSNSYDILNALGQLYYELDRYADARAQFELILKYYANDNDAKYMIGAIYYAEENYVKTRQYFEPLLRYRRHRNAVLFYLAEIEHASANSAAAIGFYRQIKPSRYFSTAQTMIVRLLNQSGERNRALEHLNNMSIEDDDVNFHYMRAMVAAEIDALHITESALRHILTIEPLHFEALNALGYTLADANKNLAEALVMIQKAYNNNPKSPAIIDSMGWVHYRQGDLTKALSFLQQAYELDTSDEIAAHLGEILWQLDKKHQAKLLFASALNRSPESEVLIEIIERFNIQLPSDTTT